MQDNNENNVEREGFALSVENLFTLMRMVYYSKTESENRYFSKNGGVISGSITVQGSITVMGQTYVINTEALNVKDYTITLAKNNTQALTSMVGMVVPKYDGTNYGFFGWDADGYAYVGDLTNYDGSSAITLANNSSLQKIATIDTSNTIAPGVGKVYLYDSTNNTFKKAATDNKNYVIKNGELVEDSNVKRLQEVVGEGLTSDKTITFGTSGNYTTELDLFDLTVSVDYADNAATNTQFKEDVELAFDVDENGYFVLEGFSGYSSFEVEINGQTITNQTGTYTSPRTAYAQKVIVRSLSNSNYYVSLVIYKYIQKTITEAVNENKTAIAEIKDGTNLDSFGDVETALNGKHPTIDSTHKLNADLVDDTNSTNKFVTATDKSNWNGKQDELVSGTNIKTINNESLLGSGNITIQGGSGSTGTGKKWEKTTLTAPAPGLSINSSSNIWTDGTTIYYSGGSSQYYLDGDEWKVKTWTYPSDYTGNVYGSGIWKDLQGNVYYSSALTSFYLDGNEWKVKNWTLPSGVTQMYGHYIWNDGVNIYYSDLMNSVQLYLDGTEWKTKTWNFSVSSGNIWKDLEGNIYYSSGNTHKQLVNGEWVSKTWLTEGIGTNSFNGEGIWTDGTTIYYSSGSSQYYLIPSSNEWKFSYIIKNSLSLSGSDIINYNNGTYYFYSTFKYKLVDSSLEEENYISNKFIRIIDLDTGIYKLIDTGKKYIKYNSTASTQSSQEIDSYGNIMLHVNKYKSSSGSAYWQWYLINGQIGLPKIYYGVTTTSGGSVGSRDIQLKTINTSNTSSQNTSSSETIYGSGTINLHKVAKTGYYSDLLNKPNMSGYTLQRRFGDNELCIYYDDSRIEEPLLALNGDAFGTYYSEFQDREKTFNSSYYADLSSHGYRTIYYDDDNSFCSLAFFNPESNDFNFGDSSGFYDFKYGIYDSGNNLVFILVIHLAIEENDYKKYWNPKVDVYSVFEGCYIQQGNNSPVQISLYGNKIEFLYQVMSEFGDGNQDIPVYDSTISFYDYIPIPRITGFRVVNSQNNSVIMNYSDISFDTITYDDGGTSRRLIYRISLVEIIEKEGTYISNSGE